MNNLHAGHRDRIRERFRREGLDGFASHEVLELLLYNTISRGNTNPASHRLLERFGSLSGVLEAGYDELIQVKGIGPQTAAFLSMLPALTRRYLIDKQEDGVVLDTTEKRGEFLKPRFIGRNEEVLYLLCLDKKHKVLYCDVVMEGSLHSVPVDVRRLAEIAMRVSASSVVLAHNHTQGFALPSPDDHLATQRVALALRPLAVELLDHIIVAREEFISMADSAMIPKG